jgi:hypothetical protein
MQGRNQLDVISTNLSWSGIPLLRSGNHVATDQDMKRQDVNKYFDLLSKTGTTTVYLESQLTSTCG